MKSFHIPNTRAVLLPITILFMFAFSAFGNVRAQSLLVTPKRIVFDQSSNIKEITLANTGADSTTVIITTLQYKMLEDGSFVEINTPDAGQNFATDYIRYFPKRVTLAPGKTQIVKVEIVERKKFPEGEYRSYLNFRNDPKVSRTSGNEQNISASLMPSIGITVPVIIRSGNLYANVQLTDLAFATDNEPKLTLTFQRSGNMSTYGDLIVEHIAHDGKVTEVANVKGIAVYTPNTTRHFIVDLDKNATVDYTSGTLRAVYKSQRDAKSQVLAEATTVIR